MLAPLAGDEPTGADLRWEPAYQEIKDARPKEDRGAFEQEATQVPDWNPVLELTSELLATRTKDLMIASWLCEALVHLHGFAGFRDGLQLINGLLANFWDGVYPRPQDGDLEVRVAPIEFLTMDGRGAKLPNMLRESPLTPDQDEEAFSLNYWKSRQRREGENMEAFSARAAEVEEKTRLFDEAVARMPLDFTRDLLEDIQQAKVELAQFTSVIDEKFGDLAPGTSAMRGALDECLQRVTMIYKDKGGFAESGEGVPMGDGEAAAGGANGQAAAGTSGPIKSREDAFRRLREIAGYLRQKEPQNPIYLLLDKAVRWSEKPFEKLLAELIKDGSARDQVAELLGITNESGDENQ